MPVIEYKLVKTKEGNEVPPYVKDGGNWRSPLDFSMVGWVDPKPRKYYVPDTILELDELLFLNRMLEIHSANPFMHESVAGTVNDEEIEYMDSASVSAMAIDWYNDFVEAHS